MVNRAIVTDVAREEILQIKKKYITVGIALSEKAYGNKQDKFSFIIGAAITILAFIFCEYE